MNAAKKALENSKNLFPQLDHQKKVIANSLKRQKVKKPHESDSNDNSQGDSSVEKIKSRTSSLETRVPKQYRLNIVSDASDISSSSLDENSSDDSDSDDNSRFDAKMNNINKKHDENDEEFEETITVRQETMESVSPPERHESSGEIKPIEDICSELSEGEIEDS